MASALSHSRFPCPDSDKQGEDVPAADFSIDSTEIWREPEALSARHAGKERMEPFSQ